MTSVKEWIDKKIEDKDVNYFEYVDFSSIVEVGKGGFGKVSKACLANKGLEVALKSFDGNLNNEKDKLNEFIKEVGIVNSFLILYLVLYIKLIFILLSV